MANRFETRELERSILHLYTKSPMVLRGYIHQAKLEWFTSNEREYILESILRTFDSSKSLMTLKLLHYELSKSNDQALTARIVTEWELIEALDVHESPDALIEQLEEARLGRETARICEKTFEKLESGYIQEAVELLRHETIFLGHRRIDKPVSKLTDYESRLELLKDRIANPQNYRGINTGFPTFDKKTGGLFPAELTVFSALTGVGKSTMLKQIAYNLARIGFNTLFVTNEESEEQVKRKFDSLCAKLNYLNLKRAVDLTDDDIKRWINTMEEMRKPQYGVIFIKEIPQFSTVLEIERTYMELEQQGIKSDAVIIDYMDHISPTQRAWNENDEQAKIAADCKGLSITLNKPVVTATQAATVVEEKTQKGRLFGKMDVYGSKRKVHAANTLAGITEAEHLEDEENLKRENEWERDIYWNVTVIKNRDGPAFRFRVLRRVQIGLVSEVLLMNAPQAIQQMNEVISEGNKMSTEKDQQVSVRSLRIDEKKSESDVISENLPLSNEKCQEIANRLLAKKRGKI